MSEQPRRRALDDLTPEQLRRLAATLELAEPIVVGQALGAAEGLLGLALQLDGGDAELEQDLEVERRRCLERFDRFLARANEVEAGLAQQARATALADAPRRVRHRAELRAIVEEIGEPGR